MKAVALLSGGLDGILAARIVQSQGIEVVGLHFVIPFKNNSDNSSLKVSAKKHKIKLRTEYLAEKFVKIVKKPRYGYGKRLNPCIDCKILMLKEAKKIMNKSGAGFVVTGEVLGQRPMSQNKQSLSKIEGQSGLQGLLLRPLSAKLLPATKPENNGWINRAGLLDICGRGRKVQMSLARKLGIDSYSQPAGGCLLTDACFCSRLKDLLEHNGCCLDNIELLKIGRHFRLSPRFKLVVGRNEEENKKLLKSAKARDLVLMPEGLPGPTGLGRGIMSASLKKACAQIIAGYTLCGQKVRISCGRFCSEEKESVFIQGIDREKIKEKMI